MKTYLALTIGPIVKTLMTARKTRHLWAVSYSFAYIMKEIAKEYDTRYPKRVWLKPALGDTAKETFKDADKRAELALKETGVGIFPDHLILSAEHEYEVTELRDVAKDIIENFGKQVVEKLTLAYKQKSKIPSVQEMQEYLLQYFQIYTVIKQLPTEDENGQPVNPILEMSELLSTVEQQQCFPSTKENWLMDFFDVVTDSFLTKDAFGGEYNFLSIPEIALTSHLQSSKTILDKDSLSDKKITCKQYVEKQKKKDESEEGDKADDKYIDWVKGFIAACNAEDENKNDPINFFTGQKYIAIVQADGDNIGKLLKSLPSRRLGDFSEKLTEFAVEAAELVQDYDGMPVYFGGDDALFFAPVINTNKQQNIFLLLRAMDEKFQAKFKEFDSNQSPSLSFGLSITYVKYPLYEALESSRNLLFEISKEGFEGSEIDQKTRKYKRLKNNIAFRVLKHSGSSFGGLIHLDKEKELSVLEDFLSVFQQNVDAPNQALRSIIYRIPENEKLFELIGKDKSAMLNFLDNSFDEDAHIDKKDYLETVARLINHVYTNRKQYPKDKDKETFSSPSRIAYNLLKTIAFLTTPES